MSLWPSTIRFWFQTYFGHENSTSYLKIQAGKTFSCHGHALVTLYVQFLCSDWSKSDRWVHAENLCSIMKLVYFWQLKLAEFCVNLWCFFMSFSTGCTKWNTAAIKSLLLFMAGLFIGFLVEKCSILKLVYFDSWRWQSFLSTWDVFYCLFPLDAQNEIQLLSTVFFCYWEMRRLSKSQIRFRMTSFSFFTLLDAGWKVPQAAFRSCISNGKPE